MRIAHFRRIIAGLAGVVLLSGCGIQQVQPHPASTPNTQPTVSSLSTPAIAPTPAPVPTPAILGGDVAAVVNGHPIPMSLFRAFYSLQQSQSGGTQPATSLVSSTLDQLIQYQLIQQYAAAHGITVPASRVNALVQRLIKQAHGRKAAAARLKSFGFNFPDLRYYFQVSQLAQSLRNRVTPLRTSGPMATVRHILISPGPSATTGKHLTNAQARSLAGRILAQVKHGASFARLARKYSADSSSAANGGKLPPVYPGTSVAPFDYAVFHDPLHTPELVHSRYGYHILEVLSRTNGPYTSTAQQQVQLAAFDHWLAQQQQHASIRRIAHIK